MTEAHSNWDDVRRMADELELKIHLGTMEARDRWAVLKPRLAEMEQALARAGKRIDEVVTQKMTKLDVALRKLREDLASAPKP